MRAAVVVMGGGEQNGLDRSVWWIALVGTALLLAASGCGKEEAEPGDTFEFPALQKEGGGERLIRGDGAPAQPGRP